MSPAVRAVFFDFDGVLAESVEVKTAAFAELYRPFGPAVEREVIAYHRRHGGVSRFAKIRHYETVLLGRAPDEARVEEKSRAFSRLVLEKVIAAPWIPGAREALQWLASRGCPLFLISGTPEEELRRIVAERGMAPYFTAVRGSPLGKAELLAQELEAQGLDPRQALFVGDAMTDYEAAAALRMPFLGIVAAGEDSPFPPGTPQLPDLTGLPAFLEQDPPLPISSEARE